MHQSVTQCQSAAVAAAAAAPVRLHRLSQRSRHPDRACATAESPSTQQVDDSLSSLRQWISDAGGYIHPQLTVIDAAPTSGCRGIIAAAPIPLCELEATGPVIQVPKHLQFTASTAAQLIHEAAGDAAAAAAQQQLSDNQIIAAALAHQLHTIRDSFWQPYLASLPDNPPNPWLCKTSDQVKSMLQPFVEQLEGAGETATDWVAATVAARQQQLAAAAEVEALLGRALGISKDGVMQAAGHVASRSLACENSGGMCPVIDLVNHHASAAAPMLQLDDSDRLVMTVLPIHEGEAVAMDQGQELLILYKGGYTPLEAFLKFGFVAQEWWQP